MQTCPPPAKGGLLFLGEPRRETSHVQGRRSCLGKGLDRRSDCHMSGRAASVRAAHAAGESRCQHDCRNAWQSVNRMSSNTFPCKTQGFRKVTTRLPDCLAICQSKARQPVNRMPGNPSTACLSSTNLTLDHGVWCGSRRSRWHLCRDAALDLLLDRQGLNAVRDALVEAVRDIGSPFEVLLCEA